MSGCDLPLSPRAAVTPVITERIDATQRTLAPHPIYRKIVLFKFKGERVDGGCMGDLQPDDFHDVTRPEAVAVSPDGERVAFVARESDPEEDERPASLFVAPADGSRDPHRLTRVSGASQPAWSPDGRRLGFIGTRDEDLDRRVGSDESEGDDEEGGDGSDEDEGDNGGSDEPKPQVWYFDVELGGDAVQVTDREEGVREFDWGPDGERIVVSARDPTDEQAEMLAERRDDGPIEIERLQHKANGAGWLDEVTSYRSEERV